MTGDEKFLAMPKNYNCPPLIMLPIIIGFKVDIVLKSVPDSRSVYY